MSKTASDDPVHGNASAPKLGSALLWLAILVLVLGFAFQGTRALWSPDEGRYTNAALQMVDSGNYLVPTYSPDQANFSKPPVTYWTIAASVKTFGRNTWAIRAPYALAFVLTVLLLYAMGRRCIPDKPWLPGLIYGTALWPFLATNIVSTDVLLTFFEALAMLGFIRAAFPRTQSPGRLDIGLMWLGFGLAFLTKGPPGLLPLLGVIPFIVRRDGWRAMARYFAPVGLAIFFISGLLWYAVVMLRYPWLTHYFFHREIYDRLFTPIQHRNSQWYGWIAVYLPVLTLGALPWWPALARGLRAVTRPDRWRQWWRQPSIKLFLLLWFLVPLAIFCLARSRLPLYVLPLFLPLSLMLALDLQARIDLQATRQRIMLGFWVLALLVMKGGIGYFAHPAADNRLAAQQLNAASQGTAYGAVAFIEDTGSSYAIEESTPWGIRLYLNKPVYGIAWKKPGAAEQPCRVLRAHHAALFVVDNTIKTAAISSALTRCTGQTAIRLGTWRHSYLERVQN